MVIIVLYPILRTGVLLEILVSVRYRAWGSLPRSRAFRSR